MTKKYIITSAYTGQRKEILGETLDRGADNITIFDNNTTVAIIPNLGFMIEVEKV